MNKTWFVPPIVVPILIGLGFGDTYNASDDPLMSREMPCGTPPLVPLNAPADEQSLAHDMIEVHGAEAAPLRGPTPAPRRLPHRNYKRSPGSGYSD